MSEQCICGRLRASVIVPWVFIALAAAVRTTPQASAQAPKTVRTGVVQSVDGVPLKFVWVQELGALRGRLTEADGQFAYPAGRRATLLFVKDGFRPEIRVTGGSEAGGELFVVLQPEDKPARSLPFCYRHGQNTIHELELGGVRGVQVRRNRDADYVEYSATYDYGGRVVRLSSMSGIHVAGLTPTTEWLRGLESLTVRSLRVGDDQWFDLRGTSAEGLESRWVGYAFAHVEYSRVPPPVARVFDKAIDNGCCR
jgi:hypothetical protein